MLQGEFYDNVHNEESNPYLELWKAVTLTTSWNRKVFFEQEIFEILLWDLWNLWKSETSENFKLLLLLIFKIIQYTFLLFTNGDTVSMNAITCTSKF